MPISGEYEAQQISDNHARSYSRKG